MPELFSGRKKCPEREVRGSFFLSAVECCRNALEPGQVEGSLHKETRFKRCSRI